MEFVGVVGGVGTTVEIMGDMSTSCHKNSFCITGHLYGSVVEQTVELLVILDALTLMRSHCNDDWYHRRICLSQWVHLLLSVLCRMVAVDRWYEDMCARRRYQRHGQVITSHRYCGSWTVWDVIFVLLLILICVFHDSVYRLAANIQYHRSPLLISIFAINIE